MAASVSLRSVTRETLPSIAALAVTAEQQEFVASNVESISEAYFTPTAWFKAVYAADDAVGFLMVDEGEGSEAGTYYLWRFMIDARYQGRGYGRAALDLLLMDLRARPNARYITLSHVPGNGVAGALYSSLGFVYTGEVDHGEPVMMCTLTRS